MAKRIDGPLERKTAATASPESRGPRPRLEFDVTRATSLTAIDDPLVGPSFD